MTDNAALTIVDCTGTGVVKGTVPAAVNRSTFRYGSALEPVRPFYVMLRTVD